MRVSFFEDFIGRGGTDNTHLFDSARCAKSTSPPLWELQVITVDNAQLPGVGWLRMLVHGRSGTTLPGGCSGDQNNLSIILTSPEIRARKNPIMTARVMFRSESPIPESTPTQLGLTHQEILIGFTTVGQPGFDADDFIGFRTRSGATLGDWQTVYKYGGFAFGELVDANVLTPEYDVPHEFTVALTEEGATYHVDGHTASHIKYSARDVDLHMELQIAIYDNAGTDIHREILVDFVSGSLDR